MVVITLSDREYQSLLETVDLTLDTRVLRRALALLWLSEGEDVQSVADHLFVTPRTVYRWVERFHHRGRQHIARRVADGQRRGRPPTVSGIIDELILPVLDQAPQERGYPATVWTAPLLCQYLRDVHQLPVSRQSVGLALDRLGFLWKRPRYRLARRSPHWRQAKGGSNGVCAHANTPLL